MAPSDPPADPAAGSGLSATGIAGLDDILHGGLSRDRLYVLEGVPGSGKTTVAVQFVREGRRLGEPTLYVTLSETAAELADVARSHGWSLDGIEVRELVPSSPAGAARDHYTVFHPAEVELEATTEAILADVERLQPSRIVIDSLSELRLLAGNPLRYRRQILALKQYFIGRGCTVLLLDDLTAVDRDLQVQSIANGVILLEQLNPEYGAERRRLRVVKHRGRKYRGGYHDYAIVEGGLAVFPRLIAAEHRHEPWTGRLACGIEGLDALLGGGIERGTSTLVIGAAGTGKSTLAAAFACASADRGDAASLFLFDESVATLVARCTALGLPLARHVAEGRIRLQGVDPAELSPGEFAHAIRTAVASHGARIVVVDTLNGYLNAMPGERHLVAQLHELLAYLGHEGVTSFLVGAHAGLVGGPMQTPVDASYLADNVVLLRYFEHGGEVRQAISVVKKRGGLHERAIREFEMGERGIRVGEPLREFRGVLTGIPVSVPPPPADWRSAGAP